MDTTDTVAPDATSPRDVQARRRWLRVLLAGILVLIVAILAGGAAWSHHLTTQAQQAYAVATQAERTALAELADTAAAATTVLKDSKDQTSEDQARTELATSLEEAESLSPASTPNASDATRSELQAATQAAVLRTQVATDLTATITTQVQAVKDSIAKKELADAKKAVTQQVALVQGSADAARTAIDDSSGKVADDHVRVDAETARTNGLTRVAEAQKLLASDDVQALQAMANTLADANTDIASRTQAVTDAHTAWQQAQDAAAAAQTPAQTRSTTTNGASTTSSGSSWSAGSTGGGASSPSTSTPTSGGSSGGQTSGGTSSGSSSSGGGSSGGGGWVETGDDPICLHSDTQGNTWEVPCN